MRKHRNHLRTKIESGEGTVPVRCRGPVSDVGRRPTGRAAHHHVLHRQDHQVSAVRWGVQMDLKLPHILGFHVQMCKMAPWHVGDILASYLDSGRKWRRVVHLYSQSMISGDLVFIHSPAHSAHCASHDVDCSDIVVKVDTWYLSVNPDEHVCGRKQWKGIDGRV